MKILHIIDSEGLYGAEVMLLNLASEQVRLGHHPVIASIRQMKEDENSLESEADRRKLDSIVFRMHDGPNILGAWRILQYAHAEGFQVMHAHGYKGNILFGFIPKAFRRIPLVSTLHGWANTEWFSKMRLYEYIDLLSLRYMDAVCVVNKAMFDRLRPKNLKCKVHVIPNGIPPLVDSLQMLDDKITEFCLHGFTIVSIGRLSKEKGHGYLIQAFDSFSKNVPEGRLLIIGEGPEREILERIIRERHLSGKVFLPGYREQAWRYLHNCRVFVLPSLTEGLPITLLEAMQTGVPVIATSVGGIPQVIKPSITGILVSPKDPRLLSESMFRVYHDYKEALEMAQWAKTDVINEYSSYQMAQRYVALYQSVLN